MFDPFQVTAQIPIFQQHPELEYVANAATTHKPQSVLSAIQDFYAHENANIHRGLYPLANQASQRYERVRQQVAAFIRSPQPEQIVFTSGTTASINLVANGWVAPRLQAGESVIISAMEHHANLIPWQQICQKRGATLHIIPLDEKGALDLAAYQELLSPQTRLVALIHISNSLGVVNPIEEAIHLAHQQGVPVLVDAAQSMAHYEVDVTAWAVDFLAGGAHKMYGPTGIGFLYGKAERLEEIQPVMLGGDMIRSVSFEASEFAAVPQRLEAGTQHVAGVVGLGAAISFLEKMDRVAIRNHLHTLTDYAIHELKQVPGLKLIGPWSKQAAILSFIMEGIHPHDLATGLAIEQIAVRAGHHCTQPLMELLGLPGTTRLSLAMYNTRDDIDRLIEALKKLQTFFS